jgi:hypothetical protein
MALLRSFEVDPKKWTVPQNVALPGVQHALGNAEAPRDLSHRAITATFHQVHGLAFELVRVTPSLHGLLGLLGHRVDSLRQG